MGKAPGNYINNFVRQPNSLCDPHVLGGSNPCLAPAEGGGHTAPVIVKIQKLIAPLCHNPERILKESYNDEKPSNCGQVPVV